MPDAFRDAEGYAEHNDVYVLDLRRGGDVLYEALSLNRRRQVRTFSTESARMVDDPDRVSAFFLGHPDKFLQSRGATGTYAFTRAMYEALSTCEDVVLLGVEQEGPSCSTSTSSS